MKPALIIVILILSSFLNAQDIREYQVKRISEPLTIDGQLNETDWQAAPLTERFIFHQDGGEPILSTHAKMMWDDTYLYIGFICEDPDVWGTYTERDDYLWNGEVVEILCDPDGDGLNYFEVQVNPLETILDLFMNKAYSKGGSANIGWNLDSIKAAVWVDGTLNDKQDTDVKWECEVALPFAELAFTAPSMNFPPQDGDEWRILVTRYDYSRYGAQEVEVTAWNQTNSPSFHVPERFGRIFFSDNLVSIEGNENTVINPENFRISTNYPNPFNSTTIFDLSLLKSTDVNITIYDILGRKVLQLANDSFTSGNYRFKWNGTDTHNQSVASGIYFFQTIIGNEVRMNKVIYSR